jgi:hypothetical protein
MKLIMCLIMDILPVERAVIRKEGIARVENSLFN